MESDRDKHPITVDLVFALKRQEVGPMSRFSAIISGLKHLHVSGEISKFKKEQNIDNDINLTLLTRKLSKNVVWDLLWGVLINFDIMDFL